MLDETTRSAEYAICKKRGHQAHEHDGGERELISDGKTWFFCAWCGTKFANHVTRTSTLHEIGAPDA